MPRFSLRTLGLSLSLLVLSSQLSRPPTCSTERRPCVDTRSLTLWPRASEISVTFCRFGRNVRFVLLLAWETLCPTCRPLPVSSQTRDMVFFLIFVCRTAWARRAPPVSRLSLARQRCPTLATMATAPQHLRLATMRALIFILIVAIIVIIAAVATGFLNINQTREAKAPAVSATPNGVTAKGGQAPAFDVE